MFGVRQALTVDLRRRGQTTTCGCFLQVVATDCKCFRFLISGPRELVGAMTYSRLAKQKSTHKKAMSKAKEKLDKAKSAVSRVKLESMASKGREKTLRTECSALKKELKKKFKTFRPPTPNPK